jgi:hypothetical protein
MLDFQRVYPDIWWVASTHPKDTTTIYNYWFEDGDTRWKKNTEHPAVHVFGCPKDPKGPITLYSPSCQLKRMHLQSTTATWDWTGPNRWILRSQRAVEHPQMSVRKRHAGGMWYGMNIYIYIINIFIYLLIYLFMYLCIYLFIYPPTPADARGSA